MYSSSITPTYYRIVWNGASTNNYNALTGTAAGGVDNCHPERYNRRISITGTQAAPSVTAGNSIYINDVKITFSSTTLSSVISDINALSRFHGVYAHQETVATYLTLTNAPTFEGNSIWIKNGTGTGLTNLGLTADVYSNWPTVLSTALSLPLTDGDDIKINGITVTFTTAGGLNIAGVVSTINAQTWQHNVVAYASANLLQLTSNTGQPFTLAAASVPGVLASLGFTAAAYGGYPTTYASSIDKERACMRWDQIVANLGLLISPVFLGDIVKTGNQTGSAAVATMSWTVGYDRPDFLRIEDSTSPGTYLSGVNAVKRLVAMSLIYDLYGNQEIYDPTISTFGSDVARVNPLQIMPVVAAQLDNLVTDIEQNLTVTMIANI